MRRPALLSMLALSVTLVLAACSSGPNREFSRYYDPHGLFSTNLPAANDVSVSQPQPAQSGPSVLTGVVSSPPQASPSPQSQLGGGLIGGASTQPTDRTVYEAFVVTTDSFPDLSAMALAFLTGDPHVDVQVERSIRFAQADGRLVVGEVAQDGQPSAGIAAAITLGDRSIGYLVAALFPPGDWDREESDFLDVVASFRPQVPPGLSAFPLAG